VIATVSDETKAGLASAAGAEHVVRYREANAARLIRDLRPMASTSSSRLPLARTRRWT
jgi:NADPH:quinone reductase-like Zn-dependent oxidoreductase